MKDWNFQEHLKMISLENFQLSYFLFIVHISNFKFWKFLFYENFYNKLRNSALYPNMKFYFFIIETSYDVWSQNRKFIKLIWMQDERGSLSGRLHVFIRVALGKEFFEQAPWPNLRYYRLASHIYNIFPIKSTKSGNSSISDKKITWK